MSNNDKENLTFSGQEAITAEFKYRYLLTRNILLQHQVDAGLLTVDELRNSGVLISDANAFEALINTIKSRSPTTFIPQFYTDKPERPNNAKFTVRQFERVTLGIQNFELTDSLILETKPDRRKDTIMIPGGIKTRFTFMTDIIKPSSRFLEAPLRGDIEINMRIGITPNLEFRLPLTAYIDSHRIMDEESTAKLRKFYDAGFVSAKYSVNTSSR
ncbi:MAG TPA: hypothetical protein VF810_02590 [Patescibacteria group bacterium]